MSGRDRTASDAAVWEAAQRLLNALRPCMRVFEWSMRDAMGNTNFNIIAERAADLQAALKAAGEPKRDMTDLMRRIDAAIAIGSGRSPFSCEHCGAEIPVHEASDYITEVGPAYYVCEACQEREYDRRMERLAEDRP